MVLVVQLVYMLYCMDEDDEDVIFLSRGRMW